MAATLVVVALAVAGALGMLIPWHRRRQSLTALEGRESLSDDAIYARYYAEAQLPRTVVIQLWHEISQTLKVPASKLRPEDRFGKEIGAYWITSDDLDVLAVKARERAKSLGLSVDLEKLNTVDAYIRSFARAQS